MAFQNPVPFVNTPLMGAATQPNGVLMHTVQVDLGPGFANAQYRFYVTFTSTPANVYEDGALTTPYSPTGVVNADQYGRFPAIYMDPAVTYQVQLWLGDVVAGYTDPVPTPLATTGSSSVAAVGLSVNSFGEMTLTEAATGGDGVELELEALAQGACLCLQGQQPGTPLLIVNNSATTGAHTATFTATNKPGTATSSPAGWLPIQCDGVLYYTPIWYDNNFTRYVVNTTGTVYGQTISAQSLTENGNGTTTLVGAGASASPANWFQPTATGIGANYWLAITSVTNNSGYAGLLPNLSVGTYTNIGGGLEINANGVATLAMDYSISSASGGTPVVASGTITLAGGNGIQAPDYNGTSPLALAENGTATLNGASTSNWFSPTTAGEGPSYWINITRAGGTSGYNFSAAQGTWTNIGTGLSIGLSGSGGIGVITVEGTYLISSNSSGTLPVGGGTISLSESGGSNLHIYTSGTAATETIPTGATNLTAELWAAGGGGNHGIGTGCSATYGGGGGAGGYCRSTATVSAYNGKTFTYTVGQGAGAGTGGTSSIAKGTYGGTFASMSALGGKPGTTSAGGGSPGVGGAGGTASGGTAANVTGAAGGSAPSPGTGTTGTVSGDGSPYGTGGRGSQGSGGPTSAGFSGAAVFYYT